MTQTSLFDQPAPPPPSYDLAEAQRIRDEGMKQAAERRFLLLERAREFAVRYATITGTVTADDVARRMEQAGIDPTRLGNAWGSVFRVGFVFTGEWVKSERVTNHARMNRVWRLR